MPFWGVILYWLQDGSELMFANKKFWYEYINIYEINNSWTRNNLSPTIYCRREVLFIFYHATMGYNLGAGMPRITSFLFFFSYPDPVWLT